MSAKIHTYPNQNVQNNARSTGLNKCMCFRKLITCTVFRVFCSGQTLYYTATDNQYISDLDRGYSLCLHDYDGFFTGNETIGGLIFRPIDAYDENNENTIYIQNSIIGKIIMTVSWTY